MGVLVQWTALPNGAGFATFLSGKGHRMPSLYLCPADNAWEAFLRDGNHTHFLGTIAAHLVVAQRAAMEEAINFLGTATLLPSVTSLGPQVARMAASACQPSPTPAVPTGCPHTAPCGPVRRICVECDHQYKGDLPCPRCGAPGEPIPQGD